MLSELLHILDNTFRALLQSLRQRRNKLHLRSYAASIRDRFGCVKSQRVRNRLHDSVAIAFLFGQRLQDLSDVNFQTNAEVRYGTESSRDNNLPVLRVLGGAQEISKQTNNSFILRYLSLDGDSNGISKVAVDPTVSLVGNSHVVQFLDQVLVRKLSPIGLCDWEREERGQIGSDIAEKSINDLSC
jgi:hypothetical protein